MPDTTISRDPLLRRLGTPLRGVYFPLGFELTVETNDARVLAHADASFGIFPEAFRATPPMNIRAVCDPDAAARPPWPKHSYRAAGDLFTVVAGAENFLVCDLQRREATGYFSSALLDDRGYFCTDFLEAFVYMTIQRHWATPVHAACVVRGGYGICLAGNSLSGKSSLSYFCAKSGYTLLADNSVWLRNAGNRNLLGNPSRLQLRATARDLFPELHDVPVSRHADGEEFLAVPTSQIFAGRLTTEAKPGPIVFLDRREGPPSLEPVAEDEAHRRLFLDRNPNIDEPLVMQECERVIRAGVGVGAYSMRYSTFDEALEFLNQIPLPVPERMAR